VCFAATCRDNPAAEDFRDDLGGIARAVHSKVSELIRGKTLRMKCAETGFIAKERTSGHGHAPGKQKLDGRIKPENWGAGVSQKFRAAGLSVRTTAQREDRGFLELGGAAQGGAQLIGFDLAKGRLAEALKNLGNGKTGGLFDALIQIDEAPRELAREESANSRFAGTHESGKAKDLGACGRATQRRRLSHCFV
jgi:hypothetical protein